MKYSTWDGVFAGASENAAVPFVALYALDMGASKSQIGLVTAIPALLGNILQVPYALLAEKTGRRKLIVFTGAAMARSLYLLMAALPFIVSGEWQVYALIVVLALRGASASMGAPAWTCMMADIVPKRVRGSYFSYRNILVSLASLVASLSAGWTIRQGGYPTGYSIAFILAFITGAVSLYFFWRIPEPPFERQGDRRPEGGDTGHTGSVWFRLRSATRLFSAEPNFTKYVLSSMLWNLAVSIPAPLFSVYFVENLNGNANLWGIVSASSMASTVIGQRYWGRLADRFGQKSIMVVSGIGAAALPFAWFAIPHSYFAILVNLFGGFVWAGYNLAAFNLILEITPERGRTTYIGSYNTMNGLSASVGPMLGGLIADIIGIRWVFIISGVLRVSGWFLFKTMVSDDSSNRILPGDLVPRAHLKHFRKSPQQLPGRKPATGRRKPAP